MGGREEYIVVILVALKAFELAAVGERAEFEEHSLVELLVSHALILGKSKKDR